MSSQTGQRIITIQPRSKGNRIMKFGQLIEYNMRNNFLVKLNTKCGGEANPRRFYKKNQN